MPVMSIVTGSTRILEDGLYLHKESGMSDLVQEFGNRLHLCKDL